VATYTFRVISTCAGGEHIRIRVLEDGTAITSRVLNRTDIIDTKLTIDEVMEYLIHKIVKNSGATTPAQRKTAIEAASVVL
jgi:hypothetical protein